MNQLVSDNLFLEFYMNGFNDELSQKQNMNCTDPMLQRAYDFGRIDAIVGDDVRSVDHQSNEEILKQIKKND